MQNNGDHCYLEVSFFLNLNFNNLCNLFHGMILHKDPSTEDPSKPAIVQLILFEEAQLYPFNTRQNTDYQTNVS